VDLPAAGFFKGRFRSDNPATGEDMMLAPRKVVTFNCSGKLRERVNGKM